MIDFKWPSQLIEEERSNNNVTATDSPKDIKHSQTLKVHGTNYIVRLSLYLKTGELSVNYLHDGKFIPFDTTKLDSVSAGLLSDFINKFI